MGVMQAAHEQQAARGARDAMGSGGRLLPAFLVGSTLGAAESVWVLGHLHTQSATDAALVLLYGWACYGVGAALLAACWAVWGRVARVTRGAGSTQAPIADAVAMAITVMVSAHFLSRLARVGQPGLAWLIPGCVLSGVAGGLLARWLALRVAPLRSARNWMAFNAALLVIGAMAGGLVAGVDRLRTPPPVANPAPPNILLISVDTLRSDRLGCYGSARTRTPHIDGLARDGILFEQATSPMPLTGPSHTTMLTGLYPALHGAHENGMPIRADVVTVPELLSRAGYRTAAFVSGWTLKDAACGLASRFDHYDEDFSPSRLFPDAVLDIGLVRLAAQASKAAGHRVEQLERLGERSTERALAWLARHRERHRARHGAPPFFAFVHYFDAHGPHEAPPPYDRMYDPDYVGDVTDVLYRTHSVEARQRLISNPRAVEHLTAMYDGEVSYVDDQIGRLLDGLATLGLAANTLVIFTADHGESLTEHGFFFDHGEFLYDTDVHVPLIVRFPDRRHAGTRQPAEVRLVDLAATILGVAGVRPAPASDGRSLLALLDGAEPAGERTSFGCVHFGQFDNARSRYYARAGGYKLIWNFDRREELSDRPAYEELYDLTADPAELHNLIGVAPPPLDALRTQMRVWAAEKRRPGTGPSEGVRERLRALGYL